MYMLLPAVLFVGCRLCGTLLVEQPCFDGVFFLSSSSIVLGAVLDLHVYVIVIHIILCCCASLLPSVGDMTVPESLTESTLNIKQLRLMAGKACIRAWPQYEKQTRRPAAPNHQYSCRQGRLVMSHQSRR